MDLSCFVPSCLNTSGARFPKDLSQKQKWQEKLNLTHLEPSSSSFICYDHFKATDLDWSEGDTSSLDAVPESLNTEECEELPKMCRVCALSENLIKNISEPVEGETSIASVLMMCCYPVKVRILNNVVFTTKKACYILSKSNLYDILVVSGTMWISLNDSLPQEICSSCFEDLKVAYCLRRRCMNSIKEILGKVEMHESKKRRKAEEREERVKRLCQNKYHSNTEETVENIRREIETDELVEFNNLKAQQDKSVESLRSEIIPSGLVTDLMDALTKDEKSSPTSSTRKGLKLIGERIVLPKKALEKYISPLGKFSCQFINNFHSCLYVDAEDYIYVFGLLKYNLRTLQCILPTCKALAQQRLLETNCYDGYVTVTEPHNHPPFSYNEKQKQMFLYYTRKKVLQDKTLNIKIFYEDLCKVQPELRTIIPLKNVISEICKNPVPLSRTMISSFEVFYATIESQKFTKLHFTMSGEQFYQERFSTENGALSVVFANLAVLQKLSSSNIMYVDASFKIDTNEDFKYQLVTVLLWTEDSYYPVLFAFVNKKTKEIFKKIFGYLHDTLATELRPQEIITDFEANLYYALGETYLDSHIGGSVFYYTQNLYKKVCSLNLSRDLETNTNFRSIYHMLLMLPLLPVNTIPDGFKSIEVQAKDLGLSELSKPLFDHVRTHWMESVTPHLFCVHRLENRINENVIAPFKKLKDFLVISKGKVCKYQITITQVVEKIIHLEEFLTDLYSKQNKKSFGRDLSSSQKKNVLRAWLYIETHPKININNFFLKVLGYIKCMENQLWIWGFYRYIGDCDDELINADNFSMNCVAPVEAIEEEDSETHEVAYENMDDGLDDESMLIMEAVLDPNGKVVIENTDNGLDNYLN